MSSIVISGDTSGAVSIAAPAIAGTNTMTLVAGTGTLAPKVLSTAVASTSSTSIDFTSIPSWVTCITVMFSGVSTNGSSVIVLQIGSGSFVTSGYSCYTSRMGTSSSVGTSITAGICAPYISGASDTVSGIIQLNNLTANTWAASGTFFLNSTNGSVSAASHTLSGVLDRVRITTVNGTDTFDAGTINIMYE